MSLQEIVADNLDAWQTECPECGEQGTVGEPVASGHTITATIECDCGCIAVVTVELFPPSVEWDNSDN